MSDMLGALVDAPDYEDKVPVHAFRGMRGERLVYTVRLTIAMALDLMPKPDPNVPFPNNRPLVVKHSKEFGDYWERNPSGWGCPAGLVSIRQDFPQSDWTHGANGNGMTVVQVRLPRDLPNMSEILDMQHRIFGWHLKRAELSERLRKAQDYLNNARAVEDDRAIAEAESQITYLRHHLDRMKKETITIEIMVLSESEHRNLFAQIADKAMTINASQIADYDSTQQINNLAHTLADNHPLLAGRVDWVHTSVADTVKRSNPSLIAGATLVNILRPFATGSIVGRITEARNTELEAELPSLYRRVTDFFDVLAAAFEPLGGVLAGTATPSDVRSESMLGSRTMLRVLAAVYHRLTTDRDGRRAIKPLMTRDEVLVFFKALAPLMELPLERNSVWFTTGAFPPLPEDDGADLPRAPLSRQQDLKKLVDALVLWATTEIPNPE